MSKNQYNPAIHHRQSIRLKGHDYAGGGLYFLTICAHREFIADQNGNPFAVVGATWMSPVREIIEERMRITEEKCPAMHWEEFIIMPDHFHALIRLEEGRLTLGDVVGGFKAAVTRHIRRRIPSINQKMRIWHRNYYEMIVRTPDAEKKIRQYIRMNPWQCVTDLGSGLRGMGNPSLWNAEKTGILCSRNGAPTSAALAQQIPEAEVYLGGFHSPPEQAILKELLKRRAKIIYCPAWGLKGAVRVPLLEALKENRILLLEMKNRKGDLAAAKERNTFVMKTADKLWLPHVTPGGMLDRLRRELKI